MRAKAGIQRVEIGNGGVAIGNDGVEIKNGDAMAASHSSLLSLLS